MTHVLIVEDDPQLRRAPAINLRARHYEVDTAADGVTALASASPQPPDLIILDLGLPTWTASMSSAGCAAGARQRSSFSLPRDSSRQGRRPRRRRRRLHDQAIRHGRAPRSSPSGAPSHRAQRDRARGTNQDVHRRSGRQACEHRRRRGPAHTDRVARRRCSSATPASSSGQKQLLQEVWGPGYESETNTCACTWPNSAASSNATPPTLSTCSPNRAWATASRRKGHRGCRPGMMYLMCSFG